MQNSEWVDSEIVIQKTSQLLWRVIHLPYPREKQEYSSLQIRWVPYGKIKLPKFFLVRQTLEKCGASVNYDLLCQELEALLQKHAEEGYELFSITPSFSGQSSMSKISSTAHHPFLRKAPLHGLIQSSEVLIIILKKSL